MSTEPHRTAKATLLALSLIGAAAPVLAQKTDVIVLANGDRVTGEIKSYSEGRLTVDTSHSSWIKVKWSLIASISSDKEFDVETIDGIHHFGALAPSDPPGGLMIVSGPQTVIVSFFEVFSLAPVYQRFWDRWEGSLDLGFNYTQSNSLTQFNLNAAGTYRMKNWELQTSLSSFFSKQEGVTAAERGSFGIVYERFLGNRWLVQTGIGLDRNIQLGLKLREFVGVAGGRNVIQTNQSQLTPFLGVEGNHEVPVSGTDTYNVEGIVGCRYSYFMYDYPKITINAAASVLPSFTVSGRVRVEATASVRREIVSDFYLSISIFDSYDSRDPSTGQPRNDWGPTLSIGWQF